jgi:prepilin signal peptidase PulO-like enzyme (type II secretory pathway)
MLFPVMVLFAALLGACIGSFCNVLIIRMREGRSVLGRSACMECRKTLTAWDLVPVFSWLVLRGKCRSCHTPIHVQYPLVELAGASIGLFTAARHFGAGNMDVMGALFTAVFLFFLLVIAVFDLRWQLVPVVFTAVGGVLFAAWTISMGQPVLSVVTGIAVAGGVLAAFVWGSRGAWMGEGDPVVGMAIGAALGWPLGPLALLVGFMVGGAVATVLLATRLVSRKTPVPFVPFLAFGACVVYAWGDAARLFFSYAFGT